MEWWCDSSLWIDWFFLADVSSLFSNDVVWRFSWWPNWGICNGQVLLPGVWVLLLDVLELSRWCVLCVSGSWWHCTWLTDGDCCPMVSRDLYGLVSCRHLLRSFHSFQVLLEYPKRDGSIFFGLFCGELNGIIHWIYMFQELFFVWLVLYHTGIIYIPSPEFGWVYCCG